MKGTNSINMNHATMLEAMDLWLQSQFRHPPKAKSVRTEQGHGNGFHLTVEESDEEKNIFVASQDLKEDNRDA